MYLLHISDTTYGTTYTIYCKQADIIIVSYHTLYYLISVRPKLHNTRSGICKEY